MKIIQQYLYYYYFVKLLPFCCWLSQTRKYLVFSVYKFYFRLKCLKHCTILRSFFVKQVQKNMFWKLLNSYCTGVFYFKAYLMLKPKTLWCLIFILDFNLRLHSMYRAWLYHWCMNTKLRHKNLPANFHKLTALWST